jgi:hypothetical protein
MNIKQIYLLYMSFPLRRRQIQGRHRVTSQDAVRDLGVDDHMGRVTERGTGWAVPASTLDDASVASV